MPTFGRWSVALSSERGVALQLVDRVNGPGDVVGVVGEADGRLDVFLDRGEYKVVSHGFESTVKPDLGEAKLTVRPFRETEERAVTLPDLAEVETELGDLEQVSWWIQLPKKGRVAFEAAGRHLEDFRLWRDGTWMVGEEPTFEQVEPAVGRPLKIARLAVELPEGLYRLTAYGGAGLPWADDDGSRPLYLRSGVPRRGEAGRSRLAVSKFGIDRFVVPALASIYRLEVPGGDLRGDTVTLQVDGWSESMPFDPGHSDPAVVHKELRELAVEEFRTIDETRDRVITVRGRAGQPYVLQHFRSERVYRFDREGEFWIDTVHTGHPADAVEATAMLFDLRAVTRHATPLRAEVVRLRPDSALRRQFNFHERATLFLEVVARASYELRLGGVDVDVRLEPYVLPWEKLEERPPERRLRGGETSSWDLDPGYYVLTLEPESQGIVELSLTAAGGDAGSDLGASPTARLGRVFLAETSYLLHQNEQPGIHSGVVLRPMPLDLSEPLPFALSGTSERSSLTVPFRAPGPGFLRAVAEDGTELPLRVDSDHGSKQAVEAGEGTVTVSAPDGLELPVAASLFWEPKQRREPLPELPAGALEALPDLPVLTAAEERFLELERNDRETFLVRAEEAALYRLESTGLLDTLGVLRTRVVPNLESVDDEGTGRNFLVQRYLGAGEYQLTVSTQGRSAGALGVRLAAAPVRAAGRLEPGVAARGWIESDESLEYRFKVDEPGRWRVRVLGLGGLFPVRIEDADGWPITRPAQPGDQTVELDGGEYRLVVLPQAVNARHVAQVSRVPEPVERSGHGPFGLELGDRIEHRWEEPSDDFLSLVDSDSDLPPDRWRVSLSAPVELRFDLGRDMVADLVETGSGTSIGRVTPLRGLDETVPAGDYEVHVRPARRNNRVEYDLRVTPLQLLPGYGREVSVPGTFDLHVGEPSLVEIATFGDVDVRARLLDSEGRELAQSDDRPGDWNLRLVRRLEPGEHRLDMAATDQGGTVDVEVSTLDEVEGAPLQPARNGEFSTSLVPGKSVHVWSLDPWPMDGASSSSVLMARAESAEGLRLTVESQRDGRWRSVAWGEGSTARLAYAPAAGEPLRLRLEALDRGSSSVQVRVRRTGRDPIDEKRLARGVRVGDDLGGRGVVAVRLDRPGCFEVGDLPADARVAGFEDTALRSAPDLAAGEGLLLIESASGSTVRAGRWQWPADGEPRRLRLLPGERATCDLEPSDALRLLSARGLGRLAMLTVGDGAAQAADGSEALALALARTGRASIFLDQPGGSEPAEVELRSRAFGEAAPRGAEDRIAGQVVDGESVLYTLPAGRHRLRLSLGAGVTAAVARGRRVELLHRASGGSSASGVELVRDLRVDESGDAYLRLMGPGEDAGLFDVSLLQLTDDSAPAALAPGRPFERRLDRAGLLDLPLASLDSPRPLHLRGAERVTLLGADGSVQRSDDPAARLTAPAGGGRLVIEHGPGAVITWLGDGPSDLAAVDATDLTRSPLEPPSVQRLSGGGWAARVDLAAPRVLHLRAPTSALSIVGESVKLHTDDLALDVWLPAGTTDLTLRPLAGDTLSGELEATASEVVEIGEGLGPEMLLAPGGERWTSFQVERSGRVGVAVRADSEVVGVRLLDVRGNELAGAGGGALHLAELEPGRYLMALSLAPDQAPVRVRPVVVGLERPSGPPDEVVRKYLALAAEQSPGSEP